MVFENQFEQAEEIAKKAGDSFVTVERLLLAISMAVGTPAAKALSDAKVTPQNLNRAIEEEGETDDVDYVWSSGVRLGVNVAF